MSSNKPLTNKLTRFGDYKLVNQTDESNFDVVIHSEDCSQATQWAKNYFGLLKVEYLHSDFDHNHTYRVSGKLPKW